MDQIVYDLSSQSEAEPNIFIKKDWVSILDNQNGIYSSNQAVIDTSQFSNSNKWISYREAYFTVPMLMTLTQTATGANFFASLTTNSCDYALGLKNWYGTMIHSFSVDLAGTTIIQQTPFQSLWNSFRLLTTLSYQDLVTLGPSIGFYPDNSSSWFYQNAVNANGSGVCNNQNFFTTPVVSGAANALEVSNSGLYQRQRAWNFNSTGLSGPGGSALSNMITQQNLQLVYRSSVLTGTNAVGATSIKGLWQAQIVGQVFLKHLHSFFDKIPLVKGMFMKMTLNLNNSSTQVSVVQSAGAAATSMTQSLANSSFPLGGVCPIMLASGATSNGFANIIAASQTVIVAASLYVGARCYESNGITAGGQTTGYVNNLTLSAPCYTFNPAFEGAYLSNAVRKIDYEDIYQYQVLGVTKGANFNNLVSNGIAGIKSVLVIPFHAAQASTNQTNLSIPPLQSVFDPAGGGTTSPLSYLNNFNVVVSGQNAIYNTQKYTYEAFINQLNGQNSVNGNQIDGLGSGLISQLDFDNCYNYYYVNVERCLPIEKGVSKSVSIVGQNVSEWTVDLYVFVCYGISVSINILLGSRV